VQLTRSLSFKASSPSIVRATSLKTDKPDKPAGHEIGKLGVIEVDPMLAAHQIHLRYRYREFVKRKAEIEKVEGSLENFAKGEHSFTAGHEQFRYCQDEVQYPDTRKSL
jgi:hypothetical protein